jgi:hypothetical protein
VLNRTMAAAIIIKLTDIFTRKARVVMVGKRHPDHKEEEEGEAEANNSTMQTALLDVVDIITNKRSGNGRRGICPQTRTREDGKNIEDRSQQAPLMLPRRVPSIPRKQTKWKNRKLHLLNHKTSTNTKSIKLSKI